jgi:cobalt-zinc-cadmium efflux system protein
VDKLRATGRSAKPTVQSVDCAPSHVGLADHTRGLRRALGITLLFMAAEFAGGWWAHSLALLADAGHMLGDGASLALALFMAGVAQRPATPQKTYGYLRVEIFAAFLNGIALVGIAGWIVWAAAGRLRATGAVRAPIMIGIAAAGLVANLVAIRVLHHGHRHSLNVRGAYLHVVSDLLGSIGTLVAGVVIAITGWNTADPLISMAIALLILVGAWRLLRESVDVLLEATPKHVSVGQVEQRIASIPGVSEVHDLHVWTVTSGMVAMTGHAVVTDPARTQGVLETIRDRMGELDIHHVTMQIESTRLCGEAQPD